MPSCEVLLEMMARLWHCAEFDGEDRDYEDIQLVLIEAGKIKAPPPERVRWGPVYGPKTRHQVLMEEIHQHLVNSIPSFPLPPDWRVHDTPCKQGQTVLFHRLPVMAAH